MISFLPDTVRNSDGSLTVDFGTYFPNAVLVLKRTVFDGMKQEEESVIEIEIRQLMAKTLATAGKEGYDADENIQEWQELGARAKETGEQKYMYADVQEWSDDIQLGSVVTETFLSLRSLSFTTIQSDITEWRSDLPALEDANCLYISGPLEVFDAKMPNLEEAFYMFSSKENLRSFNSKLPSLTNAAGMFQGCSGLTSFKSDMPSSLTTNTEWMFYGCKLDIESVERISSTIASCTATGEWAKTIHLGVSQACYDDDNFQSCIDAMGQKGWVVAVEIH